MKKFVVFTLSLLLLLGVVEAATYEVVDGDTSDFILTDEYGTPLQNDLLFEVNDGYLIKTQEEQLILQTVYGTIYLQPDSLLAVIDTSSTEPTLYLIQGKLNLDMQTVLSAPVTIYTPTSKVLVNGLGEFVVDTLNNQEAFFNFTKSNASALNGITGRTYTTKYLQGVNYLKQSGNPYDVDLDEYYNETVLFNILPTEFKSYNEQLAKREAEIKAQEEEKARTEALLKAQEDARLKAEEAERVAREELRIAQEAAEESARKRQEALEAQRIAEEEAERQAALALEQSLNEKQAKEAEEALKAAQEEAERQAALAAELLAEQEAQEEAALIAEATAKAEAERQQRINAEQLAAMKSQMLASRPSSANTDQMEADAQAELEARREQLREALRAEEDAKYYETEEERLRNEAFLKAQEEERLIAEEAERIAKEEKEAAEQAALEAARQRQKALEAQRVAEAEAARQAARALESNLTQRQLREAEEALKVAQEEAERQAALAAELLAEEEAQREAALLADAQAKAEAERQQRINAEQLAALRKEMLASRSASTNDDQFEADTQAALEVRREKYREELRTAEEAKYYETEEERLRNEAFLKAQEEERLIAEEAERIAKEEKEAAEQAALEAARQRQKALEAQRVAEAEAARQAARALESNLTQRQLREAEEALKVAQEEAERQAALAAELLAEEEAQREAALLADAQAKAEAERQQRINAEQLAALRKEMLASRSASTNGDQFEADTQAALEVRREKYREELRTAEDAKYYETEEEKAARLKAEEEERIINEAILRAQEEERLRAEEAERIAKEEKEAAEQAALEAARQRQKALEAQRVAEDEAARQAAKALEDNLTQRQLREAEEALKAAQEEAERQATLAAELLAEEEAQKEAALLADAQAKAEAENQARINAEELAALRKEMLASRSAKTNDAQFEAAAQAELEARREAVKESIRVEEAAKLYYTEAEKMAEELARQEAIANARAEEESRLKAEAEALALAAEEAARQAEEELIRMQAEAEEKALAEEKARQRAEELAARRRELLSNRTARDNEDAYLANAQSDLEARRDLYQEALRAEEDAKYYYTEAEKEAEELARQEALLRAQAEAEAQAKEAAEAAAKAAEEAARQAEAELLRIQAEAEEKALAEERARLAAEEYANRRRDMLANRGAQDNLNASEAEAQAALEERRQAYLDAQRAADEAKLYADENEIAAAEAARLEALAKAEAEALAKAEEEERLRQEEARKAAEDLARMEAEAQAKAEAEEKARQEEARKAAEDLERMEAEAQAKAEAEEKARQEEARKAAEDLARMEAEARAKAAEEEELDAIFIPAEPEFRRNISYLPVPKKPVFKDSDFAGSVPEIPQFIDNIADIEEKEDSNELPAEPVATATATLVDNVTEELLSADVISLPEIPVFVGTGVSLEGLDMPIIKVNPILSSTIVETEDSVFPTLPFDFITSETIETPARPKTLKVSSAKLVGEPETALIQPEVQFAELIDEENSEIEIVETAIEETEAKAKVTSARSDKKFNFDITFNTRTYYDSQNIRSIVFSILPSFRYGSFDFTLNLDPIAIAAYKQNRTALDWVGYAFNFIETLKIRSPKENFTLAIDKNSYIKGDALGLWSGYNHLWDQEDVPLTFETAFKSTYFDFRLFAKDLTFGRFAQEISEDLERGSDKGMNLFGGNFDFKFSKAYPFSLSLGVVSSFVYDDVKSSNIYPEVSIYLPFVYTNSFDIGLDFGFATKIPYRNPKLDLAQNGFIFSAEMPLKIQKFTANFGVHYSDPGTQGSKNGDIHYLGLDTYGYKPVMGDDGIISLSAYLAMDTSWIGFNIELVEDVEMSTMKFVNENSLINASFYVGPQAVKFRAGVVMQNFTEWYEYEDRARLFGGLDFDIGGIETNFRIGINSLTDKDFFLSYSAKASFLGKKSDRKELGYNFPLYIDLVTGYDYRFDESKTIFKAMPVFTIGRDDHLFALRIPLSLTFKEDGSFGIDGTNGREFWDFGGTEVNAKKIFNAVTDAFSFIDEIRLGNQYKSTAYLNVERDYFYNGTLFTNFGSHDSLSLVTGLNFSDVQIQLFADNIEQPHIANFSIDTALGGINWLSFGFDIPSEFYFMDEENFSLFFYPTISLNLPVFSKYLTLGIYSAGTISTQYKNGQPQVDETKILFDFNNKSFISSMIGIDLSIATGGAFTFNIQGGYRTGALTPDMYTIFTSTYNQMPSFDGQSYNDGWYAKLLIDIATKPFNITMAYSVIDFATFFTNPKDVEHDILSFEAKFQLNKSIGIFGSYHRKGFVSLFNQKPNKWTDIFNNMDTIYSVGMTFDYGIVSLEAAFSSKPLTDGFSVARPFVNINNGYDTNLKTTPALTISTRFHF